MVRICYKRRSPVTGWWRRESAVLPEEGARRFLRAARRSPNFRVLRTRRLP